MNNLRFYALFNSVFQSDQDDGRVITKDMCNGIFSKIPPARVSNPGPPDQRSSPEPTELPGLTICIVTDKTRQDLF